MPINLLLDNAMDYLRQKILILGTAESAGFEAERVKMDRRPPAVRK